METTQAKPDQAVAREILRQLGGTACLAMMIGAQHFVSTPNSVRFKIPARLAKDGISLVTIRLNDMDTYDVLYQKVHALTVTTIREDKDIYCDMLVATIEEATGLVLIPPRIRRV
ncbi:hypothetical protein ACPCHQ_21705 [Ralstonia thomasii]|uniref:hypothetical protein n=1 Tax=Ralstonia thomasii TaxID=3058596 RepID=UPI003C2C9490